MSKWGGTYWIATAERVVGTFLATLLGSGIFAQADFLLADWADVLAVAGGSAAVTLIKCVLANIVSGTGPGFGTAEVLQPEGVTPSG